MEVRGQLALRQNNHSSKETLLYDARQQQQRRRVDQPETGASRQNAIPGSRCEFKKTSRPLDNVRI